MSAILQSVLQMFGLPFNAAWFDEHGDWDFGKLREHGLDAKLAEIRAALRACADALTPAPEDAEEAVIEHIVSHWFTQGGQAQFGELDLPAINADGLVSAILTNVRGKLVADALAPAPEICICAAIQFADGRIVRGHRHDACFRTAEGWTPKPENHGHIQGFITSANRFVNRTEGAAIQNAAGLISAHTGKPIHEELFSEDLYFDTHDHVAWNTPYQEPADALAPPEPPTKAWLLTETRKDGRIVNEAIALTNEAATKWVRDPDLEFGQARSSLPLKVFPAPPRADALDAPPTPGPSST